MKNKNTKKKYLSMFFRCLPFIIIIVFTIVSFSYKDNITIEQIIDFAPKSIPLAILFLLIMYALKSLSFVFPNSLLMITSGYIFTMPIAITVNIIGIAIGISIPFWIGRYSGKDFAENLVNKYKKLEALDKFQKENNFFFSYIARVIGVLPCDAVSMYMGSIGIEYPKYILGGILGFLPRIIATTVIGANITNPTSPAFIISCLFNFVLALVSIFIYKKAKSK